MKKFLAVLALVSATMISNAQSRNFRVSGTVTDGAQKTIESATISLLRQKDSSAVKFSVADKNGNFVFEDITSGRYMVSVTAVGHQIAFSEKFELSSSRPSIQLHNIELVPQSKILGGVVITAKKPFIEQKIDRMVINVESSVTSAGSSALEVLEKSPGVTIDKDGNISLKGKQGVMVMMDGRPAYLSGADLVNYLKGLPASAIDQIEIMTNPSSKYDAAGNSGIINIKSKKNRQAGFNGSVTMNYGQGVYAKWNNSINLNYRTGKVNIFANANFNKGNNFQQLDILRKFKDPSTGDVTAIFEQTSHMHNHNEFSNLKLGADYFLSKKTTLGVVTSGFINPGTFTSSNTSYLQNNKNVVDSIVHAESIDQSKWKNGSVNLNFRHQFDSTGRELTSDLDYIAYRSSNMQNFTNITFDPDWTQRHTEVLRGDLPVKVNIYSAKIDYAQTIAKNIKFETGVKSSFVNTDNHAYYYNVTGNGETVDYSKTNHFLYKENINAAYVNLNRQYKKIGVQLGLRYENTSYSGKQYGNPTQPDSSFSKTYGNLFPTAFVSYQASKNNQFTMSFGRRIDRPAYQDLNPFLFFLDKYTYQAGNPFLKPQFTNNVEVSHIYKNILTTTLNYSHTVDYMNETFEQAKDANGNLGYATIVRNGNIGKRDAAGISVNAQLTASKWWTAMLYSNFNYNKFQGRLNGNGEYIDVAASNLLFNANNQFKFKKGWSAELSGFYRTKGVDGQIIIQPLGQVSAGVAKQLMKNKATLKLNVRDIFHTNKATGDIHFQNTEAHFVNTRDSRVATLSFTYRFGKPIKGATQRRKIGGADDEQNRVKVGNGN
ncbi:MAG: TonB-dependent receptor domain-containing protein [Flavisolibacter sp.]